MGSKTSLWFWRVVWASSFLIAFGLYRLYAWLPADGATGDLESFRPNGFQVQWLLEERPGGLRAGDLIVRGGGHTADEWLSGAPRGPEWRTGGIVPYEILRDGRPMTLEIRLAPVPLHAVLARWGIQLLVALAFLVLGTLVFWKRPQELAARLLMFFCIVMAVQYWGDAYNFQYTTLPWRWPFWVHLAYEHVMYGLSLATICYFTLIFPIPHPLVERFPRLVLFFLYAMHPFAVSVAMALAPNWSTAMVVGSSVSWLVALSQIGIALGAGVRSVRTARDPVARAQIRWILWCATIGCLILIPGYVLPLMFGSRPLLPHPVTMIVVALIPFTLAVAILRFRLFAIEIIINRTLVYGTLTALLIGLYLLVVRVLTLVIEVGWRGKNQPLVLFVAAVSIALAFAPLRSRVQALIDRAFYRSKLDLQRLLPEMSEKVTSSIVLDQLATLLTEELPEQLQIAWATLAILDPEGRRLVRANDGEDHPTLSVDHPLVEYLHSRGHPLMYLQPPSDLPGEAQAFLEQHRIELNIPLIAGERLVGLYNLGPKLSGTVYNHDEVRLLHLLGQQAAVAVENGRLFQAEREQRRLAQAFQEAADIVSSTLDLDQVLDHILEQVERVVAGDAFNIMLVEGNVARVVRWRGYERLGASDKIRDFSPSISRYPTLGKMMQTGKPLVVSDAAQDPSWTPLEGWEWLRSYLSAPIQVAGRTVGFLNVDRTWSGRTDSRDARRLEAFAHHAATALENARLYAETQRQLREQMALREAGAVISSTLDPETVLSRIAEEMGQAIDVTSAYISSYEPTTMMAEVLAEYIGPEACPKEQVSDLGAMYKEDDDPEWMEKMQAGLHGISHVADLNLPASERDHMQQYGARSILYIPLRIKGQLIGYAELWDSRRYREFSPEEIALCQDIAQQAAIALEHARLYEQAQQEIAERKLAEERIKASLEEKNMLLKEIHHRVKNNLQVISSLLYLQSRQVKDPETLSMFQDSQHRVRSMALVHERLYQTDDLARVNTAEYIRTLAGHLLRSYGVHSGPVQLVTHADGVFLDVDTAIPCGLIVNELVSNALKHAFPDGREGKIWIEFSQEPDNRLTLVVGDDGVGFPDRVDLNTKSLGLQLVNSLVSQLEGTLTLDSSDGTRVEIVFTEPG